MPPPLPVILTNPAGEEYTFVSYSSAARFLDGKGVECNHDILKRCIVKINKRIIVMLNRITLQNGIR